MKYRKKYFKITTLKRKKSIFLFGFYTLVTNQIMTDPARIWLKYECELGIVKSIYSFNKYLNVSKVMQFKALVTQVATLMDRQSIVSKEIQNMAGIAKRRDDTSKQEHNTESCRLPF